MQNTLLDSLKQAPIIPLVQAEDPQVAVEVANALVAGGLKILEVVLRSERALECLEEVCRAVPQATVGAGTVLSADQASAALSAGAKFIVSPGLHRSTVETALRAGVCVFPGVATPSEALEAWNLGLRVVKFFPADQLGGEIMLKALSSVFRELEFIPTGGIHEHTLAGYLQIPSVLACGGSWMAPSELVREQRYDQISQNARRALSIAHEVGS